jgi:hypothetical protein
MDWLSSAGKYSEKDFTPGVAESTEDTEKRRTSVADGRRCEGRLCRRSTL